MSELNTIQRDWLSAIRATPETLVGRGRLRNPVTSALCVVGTLCELYTVEFPRRAWWNKEGQLHMSYFNPRWSNDGRDISYRSKQLYTYTAPLEIYQWADVPGSIVYRDKFESISWLQDKTDLSNSQIADVLETALIQRKNNPTLGTL
jgi:hypothetical protein